MKYFSFVLFLSTLLIITGCSADKAPNVAVNSTNAAPVQPPLPAASIDELASGRKVYNDNCAACHKENGTGGETVFEGKKLKAENLTTAEIKGFSDEKIIGYIQKGVEDEGMPAFEGKLSEGEMRDVVKFIRIELQKMPAGKPKG
jgi:mono/diheme cytochrome c family protein